MVVDLSKAFDSVCYNLLLAKLKAYGVRQEALELIQSYLSDRFQRVRCNGSYSNWLPVRCGLPQGSLLGPLLFKIFINDVNYCVATSSLRLYADDTTQYSSSVCSMTLEFNLNADIPRLKEWFTYNYLGINSTKTQAMVLGNSSYNFEFFVDPQQVIDIKPILKILGVTLDNKLSFKDHVTITLKKAYAKIAALRRIKRLIPSSIMISLYKTYVLPHLEYCSRLLLRSSTPLKNKLEKCNFYVLRTVLNLGRSTEYK